ncbi:hypothetical protein TrVE_jg5207 [Triparma verrucosa]|uniref:Prolyl 4-hydroxylase alpha subunit domain-containing protein n=1 Tax=Triparma verrucosa TaxID=1606542 RepID=A0A9W6ZGJ0_9STRA|nr:hypothetical protein TrVE_jg5207 [Triparma verrucosa]
MVVTFSWFIFTVCCSLICITQSYIVHKPWRRRTNLFSSSSSLKPLLSDIPNSPPSFLLDGDFLNALPKTTAQHPRCAVYPTIDARYVDGCIPADLCDKIIEVVETGAAFQDEHTSKNKHSSLQLLSPTALTSYLLDAIKNHVPNTLEANEFHGRAQLHSINRRFRVYKYEGASKDTFYPHVDAGWFQAEERDGALVSLDEEDDDRLRGSRYSLLWYLNDGFKGGETNFYPVGTEKQDLVDDDSIIPVESIVPTKGGVLLFPQALSTEMMDWAEKNVCPHEGAEVTEGVKWIIRSDVIYQHEELDNVLYRYDDVVRETMKPYREKEEKEWGIYSPSFLEKIDCLYEPVMGAENLGYVLHSLIRFLKPRRVVEIGAGYTTLFILTALKENDAEMKRITEATSKNRLRLLDYPWTVESVCEDWSRTHSKLVVIDNCEHQKETASSAVTIAAEMGLKDYIDFKVGDAFEANFEQESVDLLWCDFGVGARMVDFMKANWKSVRPGGYVVVHSSLTNKNTRMWVEMIRRGGGEAMTGVPEGTFEHISLLEPHKRFQNSITILQRRSEDYNEPLFSQYA